MITPLKQMTDEWVDSGQYSAQDVIDLRDEVIRLRGIIRKTKAALEHQRDNYPTWWKYSAKLQEALDSVESCSKPARKSEGDQP